MNRYWITVGEHAAAHNLREGVGVTARSESNARAIFAAVFGPNLEIAEIDVVTGPRELDRDHAPRARKRRRNSARSPSP